MVSSIEFSYKTFSRASPSSRTKLDIRELGIQFGCVRLIPFVKKGLSLYKDRFLASLPSSKQASADFTRPVFTAVVFYLCAKKHKLKIDKVRLIEVCGTSESEFSCVSTSMKDLCHDVFEISSEKKDPKEVKGNRELPDVLPEKRKFDDGGYLSDEGPELSSYKRAKKMEKAGYEEWKSSVLSSNKKSTKIFSKLKILILL
ncbi:hypothetical protein ERO13_A07G052500v2 [Gossypium hirsutum]|uniref:Origin of replication complex subunit 6 isoform X1 n=1 Tax=Gossypium hirsutum TaxID=3635 RepID=A0ABM3C214_GOSHI|nr:origin of replication complex subunit 6-like isoform X1 [Gossypium hirsutum]KAG4190804.1 hypothetical protein ERO13_A07G052500v2 [Gossypium hirsutum]